MSPSPGDKSFRSKDRRLRYLAGYYPPVRMAIPVPGVGYPRITAPFATFPQGCPRVLVRLACLIHAANVRSEPGSNPSKFLACPQSADLRSVAERVLSTRPPLRGQPWVGNRSLKSLTVALRHDSKNCFATTCVIASDSMCHAVRRSTSSLWLVGVTELSKIKRKQSLRRHSSPSGLRTSPCFRLDAGSF